MNANQVTWLCLLAGSGSFLIALVATAGMIPLARRIGFVDRPGVHKSHVKVTPYGGGSAIFLAIALPLICVLGLSMLISTEQISAWLGHAIEPYWNGMLDKRPLALWILAGASVMHVLGLIDDRHPLGPMPKLITMLAVAGAVSGLGGIRLGEFLANSGGQALPIIVTVVWIGIIVNAMNFLDNMDGLSAGIGVIAMACIVASGLLSGQIFVPALGCIFAGAMAGFLIFNLPPARIFMGDAGSLLVGYMLAVTSILTTYYEQGVSQTPYALAMPLVILAVPLYDFVSVLTIRLREGRHPMQGDQRHFSHRLVEHGLSRRAAVFTIYLITAATGLGATLLPGASLRETITIVLMVLLLLGVIAIFEMPVARRSNDRD
jgi:UDP-GlcNAc:undecaprenyl-phosphate GlcNAc-1-phosphate transferase